MRCRECGHIVDINDEEKYCECCGLAYERDYEGCTCGWEELEDLGFNNIDEVLESKRVR